MQTETVSLPVWSSPWLPRPWKLGSIAAALVLVSLAVRLFPFQPRAWKVVVLGLEVTVPFTPAGLVALFLLLFVLSGVDWLFQDHPRYGNIPGLWKHAVLPTFAAWTLEMVLLHTRSPVGWWAALALGSVLLVMVLLGEYISAEPESPPFVMAQLGLTWMGHLHFFVAALYTQVAQWRLLWVAPLLTFMGGLVHYRLLGLSPGFHSVMLETLMATTLMGQAVLVASVMPLSPRSFGLGLTVWLYIIYTVFRNLMEGATLREALREPLLAALLLTGALLWMEWGW